MEIPETFNLAAALVDAHLEAGRGGRPALRYQGRTLSYADVATLVNRCGNMLRGLGVEIEDRVALLLLDSPEFVATFLGAVKIGAVALPLNTVLRAADYRYMLSDSRAQVLVVDESLLPLIEPIRAELRYLRHLVVVGAPRDEWITFEELTEAASPELDAEPTSKDDMCFWQYTSGTTGVPKAAVHLQHDNAVAAELYGRQVVGVSPDDRLFSVSKLFASYGLNNGLTIPFRFGATAVLRPGRPDPQSVFDVVAVERPTLFFSVPTSYAALLHVAERGAPCDFSSVRLCVSAGEALPAPLYERWRDRFGLEILDGIGSTEAGYIFISNFPGRARPGTTGNVIPGYEVRIVDEDERPVAAGQLGNLWVKSEAAAAGYWNKHEQTKRTFRGEWLVTGDRYSVDADGYYTYAGRPDDMLKVGGAWVSPVEVEAALDEHPAVLECAVVGREDQDRLTKPAAYVVLKDGQRASDALSEELRAFVRERIASYKEPRWVEFVPELPKTASGKIQRFKLRAKT